MSVPAKSKKMWTQLAHTLDEIAPGGEPNPPSEMITSIVEAIYDDYAKVNFANYELRREDLNQLAAFSRQFKDVNEFLSQLALISNVDAEAAPDQTDDKEAVNLSSVHQAKGLEFHTVFVIWLTDGMFPSSRSLDQREAFGGRTALVLCRDHARARRTLSHLSAHAPEWRLRRCFPETVTFPAGNSKRAGRRLAECETMAESCLICHSERSRGITYESRESNDENSDVRSSLSDAIVIRASSLFRLVIRHSSFLHESVAGKKDRRSAGAAICVARENDLGIGDLGALREFIDWAAEIGFTLVQLLPINETGGDNSPYNAISAIAIEPTTLDLAPGSPEDLTRNDFETALSEIDLASLRRGRVKYRQVKELKQRILEKAFANFSARADEKRQSEFEDSAKKNRRGFDDYAFFRVLIEENNGQRRVGPMAAAASDDRKCAQLASAIFRRETTSRYAPSEIFSVTCNGSQTSNGETIKSHAEQRGVALMGDIPFGVSYYSADVFSRPNEFMLDWSAARLPSPISRTTRSPKNGDKTGAFRSIAGTLCAQTIFDWWRQRVRGTRRIFHLFRIDHVLGILSHLCLSLAAPKEQRIPAARSTPDAGTNRRACAAFCSARRRDTRTSRGEQARRRRIPARRHGRSRRRACGRGRSRRGARLCAAKFAIAWHRRI